LKDKVFLEGVKEQFSNRDLGFEVFEAGVEEALA
jgi:hypothetical protein